MYKSLHLFAFLFFTFTFSSISSAQLKAAGADGPAARQAIVEVLGTLMLENYYSTIESNSNTAELSCEEESKSDISTIINLAKNKKLKGNKNNKAAGSFLKHIGIIEPSGDSLTLLFNDAAEAAVLEYCFGDDDDDTDDDDDFEEE